MRKIQYYVYVGLVMVILLVPVICIGIAPETENTENRTLAAFPSIREKGEWNQDYLQELGTYFEDHFAFRQEMISVNANIKSGIFQTSATDRVIDGTDGWLYYTGTLGDYQGTDLLSDRSLFMIAHNLSMMQETVEATGAKFCYTISPNKNTLYPENMPYYCKAGETSNLERLQKYLDEENVNYVDLEAEFKKQDEVLYLKRDSHWNNQGAMLAYNTILDTMGREHESYSGVACQVSDDYIGDLNRMLFPVNAEPEENQVFPFSEKYQYLDGYDDVEADWTMATNDLADSSVLVYRDSFGNTLFPLFAQNFGETYFTKLEPYSLSNVYQYQPEYVVVERVERRMSSLIEKPPIMQGPVRVVQPEGSVDSKSSIKVNQSGSYYVISGEIDEQYLKDDSRIYLMVYPKGEQVSYGYEASGILLETDDGEWADNGYQLYLYENVMDSSKTYEIDLVIADSDKNLTVKKIEY